MKIIKANDARNEQRPQLSCEGKQTISPPQIPASISLARLTTHTIHFSIVERERRRDTKDPERTPLLIASPTSEIGQFLGNENGPHYGSTSVGAVSQSPGDS